MGPLTFSACRGTESTTIMPQCQQEQSLAHDDMVLKQKGEYQSNGQGGFSMYAKQSM
jgi:hypothetical protein